MLKRGFEPPPQLMGQRPQRCASAIPPLELKYPEEESNLQQIVFETTASAVGLPGHKNSSQCNLLHYEVLCENIFYL